MGRWTPLLIVAMLAGCDSATPPSDAGADATAASTSDAGSEDDAGPIVPVGHLEVELGTGIDGSGAITNGSSIEVFAGSQGGFHVFVSVISRGEGGAEPSGRQEIQFEAFGPTGEALADVTFGANVREGRVQLSDLLIVLDVPGLDAVRGVPLRMVATCRAPSGLVATAERDWTMTAP